MKTITTFMSVAVLALLAGCGKPQVYIEPHSIGVVQITSVGSSFMEPLTDADLDPYREQTREMCEDWGFKRDYKTTGVARKKCLNQYCSQFEMVMRATCIKE